MNAIAMNGQHDFVTGNTIHDCGWCIYDQYQASDTDMEVTGNNIYNNGHGMMFAASSNFTCSAPCLLFEGNLGHDATVWAVPTCPYHNSWLHTFGFHAGALVNVMSEVDIGNNYFYGSLNGPCSSGFIYIEGGGSSTPSNLQ